MRVTFEHAKIAYEKYLKHNGTFVESFRAAPQDFVDQNNLISANDFTSGELVVGEPIAPVRDYRKELWVGVAIAVAGCGNTKNDRSPGEWADTTLAYFDKTFGEK
jgi:hypothetical protein